MRKLSRLFPIIVLPLLLVACGSDDEQEGEPTAAPVEPTQAVEEPEPATLPSVSTPVTDHATPGTPVASPSLTAMPIASAVPGGTPAVVASPVRAATPGAAAVAIPGAAGTPAPGMQVLNGTVSLPGVVNEGFAITDDGCVGLGGYAGVEAGRQVIVRDGQGNIIGVTALAPTESSMVCSWTFEAEVPESDYYAVSIPTVGERVYTGEDVAASGGRIELELP